jgi:ubiquinone/menaquinone biosynthesis C-methylase UbiE
LYHLVAAEDRAQALEEARRVLRPGGVVAAAAISRYISILEMGTTGRLTAETQPSAQTVIHTGRYDGHLGFVPAYFHTAGGLEAEVQTAGFRETAVYGIEGPAWPALDVACDQDLDARVDAAQRCARVVEQDPLLVNASAHVLAIARR